MTNNISIVYIDHYHLKKWPKIYLLYISITMISKVTNDISTAYITHRNSKSDQKYIFCIYRSLISTNQIYIYLHISITTIPKSDRKIYLLYILITTVSKWPKNILIVYIDYYCLKNDQKYICHIYHLKKWPKIYLLNILITTISKNDQQYIYIYTLSTN